MEQQYDLCDAAACNAAADCLSNQCTTNVCTSCFNSAQDGGETDVDCGGSICEKRCIVGEECTAGGDCGTGKCNLTLTSAKASSAPPAPTASRTPCPRRPTWTAAELCAESTCFDGQVRQRHQRVPRAHDVRHLRRRGQGRDGDGCRLLWPAVSQHRPAVRAHQGVHGLRRSSNCSVWKTNLCWWGAWSGRIRFSHGRRHAEST
jgi:hypothetical protein